MPPSPANETPRTIAALYRLYSHGGRIPTTGPWVCATKLLGERGELGEARVVEIVLAVFASPKRRYYTDEGLWTTSGGGGVQRIVLIAGASPGDNPRDA